MDHILLVEDDKGVGYVVKTYLELHSYRVTWIEDGLDVCQEIARSNPDLCILDVMLPHKDGFAIAEDLRKERIDLPMIFLTARSLKVDQLKGFKLGCDDYLIKPVEDEILLARVEAVLRRARGGEPRDLILDIGRFQFHTVQRLLIHGESRTRLSAKEAGLLELLFQNRNRFLPRDLALSKLWGGTDFFKRKSMDVYLTKLRKQLASDPRIVIRNIHGKGFILEIKDVLQIDPPPTGIGAAE